MAQARRDQPLVPTFGIELDGRPLVADMALWIVSVTVEDVLDVPGMFTIELISKEDEKGIAPWTDDRRLDLGTAVKIKMGYGTDQDVLIAGEITSLEPTFSLRGAPTLIVHGYDKRHRLNAALHTHTFKENVTDAQVAEQICSAHGVNVKILATPSKVKYRTLPQVKQTDLHFLQDRAKIIGYELGVNKEGTLLFGPVSTEAPRVVSLSFDEDLLDFRPRMALVPLTEVQARAWDPKQKQPIKASAKAGDETATMGGKLSAAQHAEALFGASIELMVRVPASHQAEADRVAFAYFNNAALDLIQGNGRVRGRTDVRAGTIVRLDELGTRFSGEYQVTDVTHHFTRHDGYVTDFKVRRNAS